MSKVRVFAPGTVANMGCGFDVMGMTLDGVGDVVSVEVSEGDDLEIENRSHVELPDDIEKNVITPAVRALMAAYGKKKMDCTAWRSYKQSKNVERSFQSDVLLIRTFFVPLQRNSKNHGETEATI